MSNPSASKKYSIEYIYRNTEGFRITNKLIERILLEAKRVNKKTLLIIEINRNEKEKFMLEIKIKIIKRSK